MTFGGQTLKPNVHKNEWHVFDFFKKRRFGKSAAMSCDWQENAKRGPKIAAAQNAYN